MISSTKLRQSLHTAISSPVSRSFWGSRADPWAAAAADSVNALVNRFLEELSTIVRLGWSSNKKMVGTNLRSSVLLLECGRAGLCGGRLCGPSMLRDMIELRLLFAAIVLSLAPFIVAVVAG